MCPLVASNFDFITPKLLKLADVGESIFNHLNF